MRGEATFERVTYRYPDAPHPAVSDLSLRLSPGHFVLVVGQSGAGKSSFLRLLAGLAPAFYGGTFAGRISIGDTPITDAPRELALSRRTKKKAATASDLAATGQVGLVFQSPETQAVTDNIEDEIAFGLENLAVPPDTMRRRVEEVLDQTGLSGLRRRKLSTLSGGERQRVAIAAALAMQPAILALDEPTSQLDPQSAEDVLAILERLNTDLGLTIVLAEHRLERILPYADRMLLFGVDTAGVTHADGAGGILESVGESVLFGPVRDTLARLDPAQMPPMARVAAHLGLPLPLSIKEAKRTFAHSPQPKALVGEVKPPANSPNPKPLLHVRNLRFGYAADAAVLRGVNLEVQAGEMVALMGRNGSGKSTLLKLVAGLLNPQDGSIEVAGKNMRGKKPDEVAHRVGYVPQDSDALLFADTLRDEIAFTRRNFGLPQGDPELVRVLGLDAHLERYPRDLSGGERQRAAIAALLTVGQPLVMLDEPTRGLDYAAKARLLAFLRGMTNDGHAVLVVTHDVESVAAYADRVVLLGDGDVIADAPPRQALAGSLVFGTQINKLFGGALLIPEDIV